MIGESIAVYLARGTFDLRGGFDKLALEVQRTLRMDPRSGALVLFVNRTRNRVKGIFWDHNGYVILYKRLAKGTFSLPEFDETAVSLNLSPEEFGALLAGLSMSKEQMLLH